MKDNPTSRTSMWNASASALGRIPAKLVFPAADANHARRSYICSLLLSTVLICGLQTATALAQNNPPSFNGARAYLAQGGTQSGASAVATADFNGDGKLDMAVATPETDGISIFLNKGDGTFAKPVHYATDDNPNYVTVADINGDGRLDLVTANGGGRSVSILLGNGDGTFQSPRNFAVGIIPNAVAVGDFNNDGKLDVAVADQASGGLMPPKALLIMLGNGDGTLQAPTSITMPEPLLSVETGDFNGDGELDLIVGNSARQWILFGNGDGTFQTEVIVPGAGGSVYGNAVAVVDINGDGRLDLAVADNSKEANAAVPGSVEILLGNGDGTFLPPLNVTTGTYPMSVRVADFNGDGKLDLAVTNTGDATVSIFPGNGDGTFQSATTYPIGANWESTIAVADFNGDGQPDVAISSAFSDNVSVLLSKGGGQFHTAATYAVGTQSLTSTQPYSIASGDFNHDGKLDLATANSASSNVSVLLGNGDGTFQAPVQYSVGKLPSSVVAADFNGDGNLDLAVCNHQDGTISILLGSSNGTFQSAGTYAASTNAIALVVGDLNGDGKLDLLVGGLDAGNNSEVSALFGNGDGTFQPAINSSVPGTGIVGITVGDLNGDGKLDLAIAVYYSNNVVLMLGNGNGTFRPAPAALIVGAPGSVAVGDFNGDGKTDIAVGLLAGNNVLIFAGNGDGAFRQLPNIYPVGNNPDAITVADVNGDGIPDLAVANINDNYVSILQGNGDGTFRDPIDYGVSRGPSALVTGDFNGDGKPDIATTGFWYGNVSILLNNTPIPVQLTSVVSTKVHGNAGSFDVDLVNASGIECRSGGANGDYTLVFRFANTLTGVNKASVTGGTGSVVTSNIDPNDAHNYVVNLTGVTNTQVVTITLNSVADSAGNSSPAVSASMKVLVGDTNADGVVNSADIGQTKSQSGQSVAASNFREDLNVDGAVNSADIGLVKSKSGTALP